MLSFNGALVDHDERICTERGVVFNIPYG
jgi:hypothetical protein